MIIMAIEVLIQLFSFDIIRWIKIDKGVFDTELALNED